MTEGSFGFNSNPPTAPGKHSQCRHTPLYLGVPTQVAQAAAIYLNPMANAGQYQSAPHSGMISARNSNKRQPRLFINVNNNTNNGTSAAPGTHHKR